MTDSNSCYRKDTQGSMNLNKGPIDSPEERKVLQNIHRGTLRQTNVTHFGTTLFPLQEVPVEIPKLLAVSRQKFGDAFCVNEGVKPLKQIFQDFKSGVVHFTGPAGSGKTTLLKEISRMVYDKEYEGLLEVDIVLFLKCCDLNTNKKTTASNLLLSYLEPELERPEITVFEKILTETPQRVLIVLDGLDTFPDYYYKHNFNISKKKVTPSDKKMSVYEIIIHLLRRHLFDGCRIITSARDMNLGHLTVNARVRVHLLGLEDRSIYNISQKLLQESVDVYEMMDTLDARPNLKNLCRTPMFLISVLYDRITNGEFSNLHSITDNLLFLIKSFIDSQERLMNVTDLEQLKQLAFDLRKKSMINFSSEALKEHNLMISSINSLVFSSPNGQNRVFFFVHQFIHEIFAALHLAGLEVQSFRHEVEECMEYPWFSFSILMMCRMVCNDSTYELAKRYGLLKKDDSLAAKRGILLKLYKEKMSDFGTKDIVPEKILFTLLALNECGDSASLLISQELSAISLDFEHFGTLWICDISALMSVAAKASKLDALSIPRSWIQRSHLQAMCAVICQTSISVTITKLDLSENMLRDDAMVEVGQIVNLCKSEELDISGCSGLLTDNPEKTLLSLKNALQQYKLKVLTISYKKESLKESEMKADMERGTRDVIYELQGEPNTKQSIPHQITCKCPIVGNWSHTSYDFVRAVMRLVPNVTDKLVVHCWRFSEENKKMLITAASKASPHLQIQLSEGNNLQGTFGNSVISNLGQPGLSAETTKLKPFHPDIWKLSTVINPKSNMQSAKTTEMESFCTHDKTKSKLSLDRVVSKQELSKIEVTHRPITENDIIDIIKDLADLQKSHELKLRDCGLDEGHLEKLLLEVEKLNQDVKMTKLSITATDHIEKLIPIMCKLMAKCGTTELNIEESSGNGNCLAILDKNIRDNKVTLLKLDLGYRNANDFKEAGDLFSSGLTELRLVECNLQTDDILQMKTEKSKINRLDISYNLDLDEESVQILPAILCKDEPLSISMEGCGLTIDDLTGFEDFGSMKIRELGLSNNYTLENEGIEEVGRIARKHSTEEISLSSCGLEEDSLDHLMCGLEDHKLQRLNLSRNIGIASCPEKIGELMRKSGVVDVDLSNCRMTSSQIEHLAESMSKPCVKVEVLNLSDEERRTVDSRYVNSIRQILRHCKCNLWLPRVSEDELKKLQDL